MGQQESKTVAKEELVQKFGKVQILTKKSSKQQQMVMKVAIPFDGDQQKLDSWMTKMNSLKNNSNIADFLILPLSIEKHNCFVCTTTNQKNLIYIIYEKINYSLAQVIKNRKQFKKYFSQVELWYLMYVLIKAASFFEEQSDCVGNIHPSNVELTENGKIKLLTPFSTPSEHENLRKIKQSKHLDVFIAPEEIKFIQQDSMICLNDCNHSKVDLFNIGLVLLATILLKDCYYVYNRTLFELNEQKLSKFIQDMRNINSINQQYSPYLLNFIQEFLIINPMARKTPAYYFSQLKKHEEDILNLKEFTFESKSEADQLQKVNGCSPKLISYIQKTSSPQKQTKFLSLAKNLKKNQDSSNQPINTTNDSKQINDPTVTKKLFLK